MLVLGIETSCDETAAAVVENGRQVLSHVVWSQIEEHSPFGGVVPEVASRAHVEAVFPVIHEAMEKAGAKWSDLSLIAVTDGPGLASSLLIGVTAARALACRVGCPLTAVNHLAGHAYSYLLDPSTPDSAQTGPVIVLLVTGGHTLLAQVDGVEKITMLGQTLDDAAGEALDKGSTMMGLGYPGGPAIEKKARGGNASLFSFPQGLRGNTGTVSGPYPRERCFSFSGLKTSLRYLLRDQPELAGSPDLAAAYQEAVFDALIDRLERVMREEGASTFACVGGVAKNKRFRAKLEKMAMRLKVNGYFAPLTYCTDNAAMIAGFAGARAMHGYPPVPVTDVRPNASLKDAI